MEYMKTGDYPVEVRARMMSGQIYAASGLGTWCFSPAGELFFSTCPNEQALLSLLRLNGELDYMISRKKGWDKPLIMSDSLGMVFIGESICKDEPTAYLQILVGPFFLSSSSVKEIERALKEKISSIQAQRAFLRVLQTVPVLHVSALDLYAAMLHYTLTDRLLQTGDYYYQREEIRDPREIRIFDEEPAEQGHGHKQEDRATDLENSMLEAIREGNPQMLARLEHLSNVTPGLQSRSGAGLRDVKNTLIVLNALSMRAAVEGGVPLATARAMEASLAVKTEACRSLGDLVSLRREIVDTYLKKVQESKAHEDISREIRESCDYIRANVHRDLSVEHLAKRAGYTTYYFSKKFCREVGVRVTDFIREARIDYAKMLLISTNRSIQDISDVLHFGTRNYFSKVFRELTGVTPAVYRAHGETQS